MKTKFTLLLFFLLFSILLQAQNTFIPDPNFEQALIDLGIDSDGTLNQSVATADISGVTILNVNNSKISDLTGIQDFTSLIELRCFTNQLSSLDVSNNTALEYLSCGWNSQITSLDLSTNTVLKKLTCNNMGLTNLDLSNNLLLEELRCNVNNLTSLDLSINTALIKLYVDNNPLTDINVSNLTALTTLSCTYNDQLTTLDLSNNIALTKFNALHSDLTFLNVRNGHNEILTEFNTIANYNLECIEVDNANDANAGIGVYGFWDVLDNATFSFDCDSEDVFVFIPDSNFEQVLIDLGIDSDGVVDQKVWANDISTITLLDVSNKSINDLTGIEGFTALENLDCSSNQISTLDIRANTALSELNCGSNQIEDLDLSNNTVLSSLICSSNQLTILNLKNGNNAILTTMNATNNSSLGCIQVDNATQANSSSGSYSAWTKDNTANYSQDCGYPAYTYIPDVRFEQALIDLGIDSDGIVNQSVATADISGVTSLAVNNKEISDLTGIQDFTSLIELRCYTNKLSSLDLSNNTALERLRCGWNPQISSLDLSNNTALNYLICNNLDLTSLNLSNNPLLEELSCAQNELTSLDLSNNTALKKLYVDNNQLTDINVSNLTALTTLWCTYNDQLTTLDLSNNIALTKFNALHSDLTFLNVRNGHNEILTEFNTIANYNLECIEVDNANDANAGIGVYGFWDVLDNATFSFDCDSEDVFVFIPDSNFEQVLIDLGIDSDGVVDQKVWANDISTITLLDVSNKSINDLTGIEGFTALENLDCSSNQISTLDIRANTALSELNCGSNQIEDLDLSNNTVLSSLICSSNQLTILNLKNGNNAILTTMNATNNSSLGCIQVDNATQANSSSGSYSAWTKDNTANYSQDCGYPAYTYIPDVRFEQALIDLGIDSDGIVNQSVATADISGVTSLAVNNKEISDLTGIQDFTSLIELRCYTNKLSSLDLSNNTALERLRCGWNPQISSLDLSNNTALNYLICNNLDLTSLNLSNNPLLEELSCAQNELTSLDLSNNTALKKLYVDNNQLTDINVSNLTALTTFWCTYNDLLTTLDLSHNVALTNFNALHSDLTFLNVRNGNNEILTDFNTIANYNLECIEVDNANDANAGIGVYGFWDVLDNATFSEMCNNLLPDVENLPDITEECEANPTAPTATNGIGDTITATSDITLPINTQGTTLITWTYDDGNGNTVTQIQNVTIEDITPPVISCPADIEQSTDTDICDASVTIIDPTATDNCTETVIFAGVRSDGLELTDPYPVGDTTITWTATDEADNDSETCTQNITITDDEAPVPDLATLPDVLAECEVTELTEPTATDNCAATVIVTNDATLPISGEGTSLVTWTYDDGNGNTVTQTQLVVITDLTAPVPDVAVLPDLEGKKSVDIPDGPTATDNCSGVITATTDAIFPITEKGLTIITWVYDDGNGNSVIQTQNVIVQKVKPHEIVVNHYPNPFRESITFAFEVPNGTNFNISIFHQSGTLVAELTNGAYENDGYTVVWNASAFIDGVYFYKLYSNGLEVGRGTILKSMNSGN